MSLIVAIKDQQDVVVASDGRVLSGSHTILSNEALKTVALNAHLCLGIAGHTATMRDVLGSLGLKTRRTDPAELLSTCQEVDCPIDADYHDAHGEISSVLRWMLRRTFRSDGCQTLPVVLLAGRRAAGAALSSWSEPRWAATEGASEGFSHMEVGLLPDEGSRELRRIRRLVVDDPSTVDGEARLTEAIRWSARYFGDDGPVSRTVFVRRLTDRFDLVRSP